MRQSVDKRFWAKVDKRESNVCWLWQATKTSFGYGSFRMGSLLDGTRRKEMAHRVAYMLANNVTSLPTGKVVMHSCDNPQCVNPAHLSLGTYAENGKAAYDRKRRVSTIKAGQGHPGAKLTEKDVQYIHQTGYTKSAEQLAQELNVSRSTITAVRTGQNWNFTNAKTTV
jgi:hypothetical protein